MVNNINAAATLGIALPVHESQPGISARYLVMAAHAGRNDRTGAKVHMAELVIWKSGRRSLSPVNCSANGRLNGSLVSGRDFSAVTCKRCNATAERAAERNAEAVVIQ